MHSNSPGGRRHQKCKYVPEVYPRDVGRELAAAAAGTPGTAGAALCCCHIICFFAAPF